MGVFVKKMCEEVKKRWPDKRVIYLPYWNYTNCPEGLECPHNLEIQMCTMAFGLMRPGGARAKSATIPPAALGENAEAGIRYSAPQKASNP